MGSQRGLAARFWRAAGATMADDDARLVRELLALREFGGLRMTAHNVYRASESRLESDYVFEDASGAVEKARAAHHVHTTGELVRMLGDAGFTEVELRASDGRDAYELGMPRLIAVA